jgi:hypothetical protein
VNDVIVCAVTGEPMYKVQREGVVGDRAQKRSVPRDRHSCPPPGDGGIDHAESTRVVHTNGEAGNGTSLF